MTEIHTSKFELAVNKMAAEMVGPRTRERMRNISPDQDKSCRNTNIMVFESGDV